MAMEENTQAALEIAQSLLSDKVAEFLERTKTEYIVDLYAEYLNEAAELDLEVDSTEKKKKAGELQAVIHYCEQHLAQKALLERGYEPRVLTKYRRKKEDGRP